MLASAHSESRSTDALPVCLCKENSNRLVSLWIMHQSDDPNRMTSVVTLYLDESATDDASRIAVVGGLLLNKSGFESLDLAWAGALKKHSIPPPLHVKDFRRPNGRLADIQFPEKKALFTDVVEIINTYKIYSIAATITTAEYKTYFDEDFRKQGMSLFGACFLQAVLMSHLLAEHNNYRERIPILMDAGNPYADHVRGAHAAMQEDRWRHMNIGSLTFDDDTLWSPLQAADVIAWASRVRAQSDQLDKGYEPLAALFDHAHVQEKCPEKALIELAERLSALNLKEK